MRHRLPGRAIAVAGVALALAACGGGDTAAPAASAEPVVSTTETTAAPVPSTAPPTTVDVPTTDATAPEDTVIVSSFDELPSECVDAFKEFLRTIEPQMEGIDWSSASIADLETQLAAIEEQGAAFDAEIASLGCERYEFADGAAEFEQMIEVAEDVAPGTVGYFQFLNAMTNGDTAGDTSGAGGSLGEGPQNCEEAMAYIEALLAEGKKMTELPAGQTSTVVQAFNLISTTCDPQAALEFVQRPEIAIFMS